MSDNVYFNYLKRECIPGIKGFIIAVFAINLVNGISTGYFLESGKELVFFSQSSIIGLIFSVIYGVLFSYTYFNGAMSIRSDRKAYIKASIKWIVIISISLGLSGIIIDLISKEILGLIFSVDVSMKTQIPWFFGGELQQGLDNLSISDIVSIIFANISSMLAFGGIGLLCGSLVYRLKKKYSILLFIGVPVLIVMYFVNLAVTNPQKGEVILMKMLEVSLFIYTNFYVSFVLNALIAIISTLIFIKLLIKAPVKEYAFDLASFNKK